MDGVIESHTAAMLAPYSDDPKLSGSLLWDPATYRSIVADLDKRGIQIFTHAIGDRAVRLTLDAYENAAKQNGTKDRRHRIEHIEDASAEDIPRFGKLGVIASFQPLHAYPDDDTLMVWLATSDRSVDKRAGHGAALQADGGVLAFGSDWPIVTLNPWEGVQKRDSPDRRRQSSGRLCSEGAHQPGGRDSRLHDGRCIRRTSRAKRRLAGTRKARGLDRDRPQFV